MKARFWKSRRLWIEILVIAGLWTIYGVFNGYITHASKPQEYSWRSALFFEVSYTWMGALLTPGVLWITRRFRIERGNWARNLGLHLAAGIVYSTLVKIGDDVIVYSHDKSFWFANGVFHWGGFIQSWNWGLNLGMLPFGLIIATEYAVEYYRRYEKSLVQAANLEAQLAQAQLQALRMQLDPHFLFNSLHAISAMVHDDPDGAEIMIARLSDLLRLSLDNSGIQEVPLRQELKYLDLYLEIERTRFADRLTVGFDIDPSTIDALVPNFILQPLVENAIRHGVGNRTAEGRVGIRSEVRNGSLVLRVTDNGPGLSPERGNGTRVGVGLATTRARLERLYGNAQSVVLENLRSGGLEACILFPYRNGGTSHVRGENGNE